MDNASASPDLDSLPMATAPLAAQSTLNWSMDTTLCVLSVEHVNALSNKLLFIFIRAFLILFSTCHHFYILFICLANITSNNDYASRFYDYMKK